MTIRWQQGDKKTSQYPYFNKTVHLTYAKHADRCLIENKMTVTIHKNVKWKRQPRKEANKMEDEETVVPSAELHLGKGQWLKMLWH